MTQNDLGEGEFTQDLPEELAPMARDGFEYSIADVPQRWNPDFDFHLTYYLAGPMRGLPNHSWPAFEHAAGVLRDTGISLVTPVEINPEAKAYIEQHGAGDGPAAVYPVDFLARDIIQMVTKCKGLILLKGWPRSRGARVELDMALDLEWPIWFYDNFQLTHMGG